MDNKAITETSILFVDDEEIIRKSFSRDLQVEHFAVSTVANGSEAIAALEKGQYDLVITDLMMPGIDGFDVLKSAKKLAPLTSVIILTGYGDMQSAIDALRLGADDFIRKPCEMEELFFRIQRCLEKRNLLLERNLSVEVLRESEERYRSILNASPDVIVITDLEGRILMGSPMGVTKFGYDREDELLGHLVTDFVVAPEDRERALTNFTLKLQGVVFGPNEYVGLRKDGSTLDIEVISDFIRGVDEQPIRIVFVIRDITERKKAVESLRESEEKFRSLAENNTDYIMRYDRQCRHTYINPAALNIFGLTEANIIGKPLWESGLPEYLSLLWEKKIVQVVETGETYQEEFEWHSPYGTVYLDWQLTPEFDSKGRVQSVLGVSRDNTERRQAVQNYQTIFHEMLDGFALHEVICDKDGHTLDYHFLAVNPAFERITGLETANVVGRSLQEIFPSIEPHWLDIYGRVTSTGMPLHFEKYNSDLKKHLEFSFFRPAPNQLACIFKDITERKNEEMKLWESERRYSALFANKINGMAHCRVITDEYNRPIDYTILQVNEAYERIIGMKKEDIESRRVTEIFPGVENYAFDYIGVLGRIALEGGEISTEVFLEATQQNLLLYAYSPISGEFTAILSDISERIRTEESLCQTNDFLKVLMETIPNPIFYKDIAGKYIGCNRAFETYFGLPRQKFLGKTVYDLAPREMADKYYQQDQELFNNGGEQQYEWVVPDKINGEIRHVIFNKGFLEN